ncbi:Transcriptional adapter ada2, partial [Ascosphaera atra]
MGVIRKKTVTRGTDGGTKFHCDVRINCASPQCQDYDLCVPCFAQGKSSKQHNPSTHPYYVIEQNSVPIFTPDWGADEELLLLEGAEIYGLGSWADIADHIGGFRSKDEVRDHYIDTYINSSNFPLPERADPNDTRLQIEISKEEFQARKKRRIEERKEAAKQQPPSTPKQKPTASVPACHEVQGYMPGRLEFEHEYLNDAEEGVQSMSFEPGVGVGPNGTLDAEMELKMIVKDIYNSRLDERVKRKRIIFEHDLLDYRKNIAIEKKKTKEERDL